MKRRQHILVSDRFHAALKLAAAIEKVPIGTIVERALEQEIQGYLEFLAESETVPATPEVPA